MWGDPVQRPHDRCGGTLGRDCTAGAGGPWAVTTQQAQDGVGGTLCRDRMAGVGWGGPCLETARQVWGGETLCRDRTAGAGGPWAETTQQARWGGTLCRDRMAGAGGPGSPGIPLGPWSLTGGNREPQTPAPDTLRGEGGFDRTLSCCYQGFGLVFAASEPAQVHRVVQICLHFSSIGMICCWKCPNNYNLK